MKKTRMYVALVAISAMLLAACGTTPSVTDPLPTETPASTATPVPTATTAPTEAPTATEAPATTETPAPTETPVATEAPAATEVPATTEVPVTTEAPAPTEAPAATATTAPTATPVPTATPAPTATPVPTKAPAKSNDLTYDFNDLIYSAGHEQTYTIQNDGSVSVQFAKQYAEAKFTLPEAVDLSHCTGITVKAKAEYANMAVKVFDAAFFENPYCKEKIVKYDCLGTGITDFSIPFEESFEAVAIGIMASDLVDNYAPYKVTVYSITFHMDGTATGKTETSKPSVEGATLLNTYGTVFGNMGTCVNLSQLQNKATLGIIKSHYNSVTSENEMKPDALLGYNPTLISVAEAKQLGYVIPDNYKETTVPKINFTKIDRTLKICAENGLKYRAHTLVWHSQTPDWFFRSGYSYSGSFVTKDVMNARMEFYIRTIMGHIYDSEYGDIVYSWDVVNEYLHANDNPNWIKIYGDINTSPDYVKLAFKIADDVLKQYGIRNQVSLIFNDFNTYIDTHKYVAIMNFINSEGKICDGFGMQAHLDTAYPSTNLFKNTVNAFLNTGLEVQITELDVTINFNGNNGHTETTQADYYYQLFKDLLAIKENGGKITGLTCWGLGDDVSWRRNWTPLLFSTATQTKKAYGKAMQAYTDAGYTVK